MNQKYDIRNYGTTVLRQAQKPLRSYGGSEMTRRWLGDDSEITNCRHTLSILFEYGKEQLRSSLEYGWSMARVWLEANILFPRWEQNIPTLGTKHSHVGNKTGLRLVIMLLLMMVVGVNEVKAEEPVEITTADDITNGTKKLYLIQTNQFQSFYMIPNGSNVSTVNLPNEQMLWYFLDAGTVVENEINVQYYYIVNNSSGKYIYNSDYASKGRTIKLGNFDSNSVDMFMFKLVVDDTKGTTGYYNIDIKPNGGSWLGLNKQGGSVSSKNNIRLTNDDSNHYIHDYSSKWKFIRYNGIFNFPDPLSPFALSTNAEKHFFKIRNKQNTAFYMSTNTSNPPMVTYANIGNDGMVWYFKEAGSDGWFKYYYIINQEADDQYMYYEGTTGGSGMTENAVSLKAKSSENENRYQFVIVQAAKVDKSNKDEPLECYTIIPKLLKDILWNSNSLGSSSIANDITMGIVEGRATTVTDNNNSHWTFESITPCADPTITFDETTKKVIISNTTSGADVYYTTTGENPTRTSTLYENGITLTENASTTVKAVTVKNGNARSNVVIKTFIYMPTITLSGGPYTYDGNAKTPSISVTVGETPISSSDYDISYENNTNAGTATITITEKTGNATIIYGTTTFTIAKANITPTVSITGWTYGTPNDPSVSGNTGNGTVTYQYKVQGAGDDTYSADKPENAGTYVVKAIIAESTNYNGATTDPVEFTISKATFNPTVSITGWTYGSPNEPSVSGIPGGVTVTYKYKVQGANDDTYTTDVPTNVGTYTVKATIAETVNYNAASATTDFAITAKSLGDGTDPAENITYDLSETEGNYSIVVKKGGSNLTLGSDYTKSSESGVSDGKYYQVTVAGINNYGGGFSVKLAKIQLSKRTGSVAPGGAALFVSDEYDGDFVVPDNMTAYIVTGISGNTLVTETLDNIPEQVPVLLVSTIDANGFLVQEKVGGITPTGTNLLKEVTEETQGYITELESPNYQKVHFNVGAIYLLYKGEFVLNADGYLAKGKIYLPRPSGASVKLYIDWDFVDGIGEQLTMDNGQLIMDNEEYYTLDGIKLGSKPTRKGLYLHNGKKMIINN